MQEYKDAVREHLSSYVCQLRQRRGLTQEEMAEKLRITARAYRVLLFLSLIIPPAAAGGIVKIAFLRAFLF